MSYMQAERKRRVLFGEDGDAVMRLIALNVIIFVILKFVEIVFQLTPNVDVSLYKTNVLDWVGLPGNLSTFITRPWVLLSHMIAQYSLWQLLGNMLFLWAFGFLLQDLVGNKHIVPLYIYGGLAGAVLFMASANLLPKFAAEINSFSYLGASACVMAIAIAATVGKAHIEVESKPHVHIFSTGDEIVGLHETPADHQIRSSNVMMLKSVLLSKGFKANSSHLADSAEKIKSSIDKALESNDIILLSGGVSAGKKDLVPSVLAEAGFETVFHKISQKPGKPLLVATRHDGKVVFAFPGNPISTLTCFWVYFLPWVSGEWAEYSVKEIKFLPKPSAELDQWIPVENGEVLAHNGSSDLISWSRADGLVWQKAGDKAKKLPYIPLK